MQSAGTSLTMCSHPACTKPKLLILPKNQIDNFPVDDVVLRIPTDIATPKRCFSCLAVKRKNPLLTVSIFKIADVAMSFIARNDRRITARSSMMISDFQQGLSHIKFDSIVRMATDSVQNTAIEPNILASKKVSGVIVWWSSTRAKR